MEPDQKFDAIFGISEKKSYFSSVLNFFGLVDFTHYNFTFDLVSGGEGEKVEIFSE